MYSHGAAVIDDADRWRLAEAFRLSRAIDETVWPGWSRTPFAVLLVTTEREFLIGEHPRVEGFVSEGHSTDLGSEVFSRPRHFNPVVAATFPALGRTSLVVIGRPDALGIASTPWVLTVLHEHFHQFQVSDPDYFRAAERLDLAGEDQTGKWMLTYPFPYESAHVIDRFAHVTTSLHRALTQSARATEHDAWGAYFELLEALAEPDRRYLSLQVWQEGVARFVELLAAEVAAARHTPLKGFASLPDATTYSVAAQELRAHILAQLANPDLSCRRRESFSDLGAGLSLLLDRREPTWKSRYLDSKFCVERCRTGT